MSAPSADDPHERHLAGERLKRLARERFRVALPEQQRRHLPRDARGVVAVDARRHVARERLLRRPALGVLGRLTIQRLDRLSREQREVPQELARHRDRRR